MLNLVILGAGAVLVNKCIKKRNKNKEEHKVEFDSKKDTIDENFLKEIEEADEISKPDLENKNA